MACMVLTNPGDRSPLENNHNVEGRHCSLHNDIG